MADLAAAAGSGPGLLDQIRIVSQLRWRVLRNSLRKKSRRLDLLGVIISSVVGTVFVSGISIAFFAGTRALLVNHLEKYLGLLFLALFLWWQVFPVLIAGFSPQFEFRTLLRFPLRQFAFYLIALAYGLADTAAIAAVIWMLAIVAASLTTLPSAAPVMLVSCLLFIALNVTIERLVGAWLEKLLAKRRSREIFFAIFIFSMVSLQFLNPLMQKYGNQIKPIVRRILPYLWLLPSAFAGDAVAHFIDHQWGLAFLKLVGLSIYVLFFSALLWRRYCKLFAGEELGESVAPSISSRRTAVRDSGSGGRGLFSFLPPQILAVLSKEISYLRRSSFLFFSLFIPPIMVFYFSYIFSTIHSNSFKNAVTPDFFFPAMMAYLVLMLMGPSYNSFAYESRGIQTYFTSPVRFREVFLAKNLLTCLIMIFEVTICALLIGWRTKFPSTPVLCATMAAVIFSIVGQLTIANWSSLSFPRKIEFGKMQGQRNSGMSVLILFAVQIVFGGVSAAILFSGRWTGNPWLPAEMFTVLAVVACAGYFAALNSFTAFAEKKKELLIDALCR